MVLNGTIDGTLRGEIIMERQMERNWNIMKMYEI